MNKTSVPIKGMHCRSCELLVEDELLKVPGIVKADVNHRTGSATVFYKNDQPGNDAIASAIEKAGYVIGHNGRPNSIFSHAISDYWDIVMVGVIAFLLYLVGDQLGIFRFSSLLKGGYGSLTVVFLVGITAGLSTCMALVGGLVLGISARFAESHPEATYCKSSRLIYILTSAGSSDLHSWAELRGMSDHFYPCQPASRAPLPSWSGWSC